MPIDKTPLPRGSKARSYVKRKWGGKGRVRYNVPGRRAEMQWGGEKQEHSRDNVSLV